MVAEPENVCAEPAVFLPSRGLVAEGPSGEEQLRKVPNITIATTTVHDPIPFRIAPLSDAHGANVVHLAKEGAGLDDEMMMPLGLRICSNGNTIAL